MINPFPFPEQWISHAGEEAEEHVPATRFTLDELDDEFEGHEEKGNVQAPPATDLLCFDDATPVPHPQKQQQAQSSEAWDPFGPSAPQAAQGAHKHSMSLHLILFSLL